MLAERPESAEPWTPKIRDWDLNATLLREIREAVVGLTVATVGKKAAGKIPPFPLPRTGVDQARRELDEEFADQIIRLATPQYARNP